MLGDNRRLVKRLTLLRWVIPVAVALVGGGYMLFDETFLGKHTFSGLYAISGLLFFGLAGPVFAWQTLTWATRAAIAEAEAQQVMQVLHDVSLDLTSHLDQGRVLTGILEQAAHLLKAEGSCLAVYDPAADIVRNIAVHNLPSRYEGLTMRLPECIAGQVVRTGEPMLVNDYRNWEGRSPLFNLSPHDAIVSVPLRWQNQVFGALSVTDRSDRRPFVQADAQVLALFADLASIALKNSELYAQVVELSQELEHKVEVRTRELTGAREELAHKAAQLRQLLTATVRIQEEERARIAQDLHDGSNQLITGAVYELHAAHESLRGERTDTAVQKLDTVKMLLRRIDAENRRIILGLRPPILDAQGLVPAIKWQAGNFQEQCRIVCTVQVSGQVLRLAPETETAIYRIVQETLNNISTHARAEHVQIRVEFGAALRVVVEDDGMGFDHAQVRAADRGRVGLIGMRERAESIGGQIQIESIPGRGTRISLQVPLSDEPTQVAVESSEWGEI